MLVIHLVIHEIKGKYGDMRYILIILLVIPL